MDWKQFFKPNTWKIIITVSLIFISLLIFGAGAGCVSPTVACTMLTILIYILNLPLAIIVSTYPSKASAGLIFVTLALTLVYTYLLSCLIAGLIKRKN